MNLKRFLAFSIIVHATGAIALYFYYNPIVFAPKPVKSSAIKENASPRQSEGAAQVKPSASDLNKEKKISSQLKTRSDNKSDSLKPPVKKNISQQESMPPSSAPQSKTVEPSIKTEASPVELDLQKMKANPSVKPVDMDSQIAKAALIEEGGQNAPSTDLIESEGTEDFEVIEDSETTEAFPVEPNIQETKTDNDAAAPPDLQVENSREANDGEPVTERKANPAEQTKLAKAENADQTSPSTESASSFKEGQFKDFQDVKQKKGNPPLDYPDAARRAGMEGTVSVLFFVTNQGLVDKIQLQSSSGYRELDNFVLRSLSHYEFLPDQEAWVQHNISFNLEGEEKERLKLRTLD